MALVLISGVVLGWEVRRIRTQQAAVATIRAAKGIVRYDFQFRLDPEEHKEVAGRTEPPAPALLRRWLGDDPFQAVASVNLWQPVDPDVARALAALDGLVELNVGDTTGLTPERLAEITRAPRLERLRLGGPGTGGPAADAVGRLLATVAGIAPLRDFSLLRLDASDAGLMALARSPGLDSLTIAACPSLTDEGVARLLAALRPGLTTFAWSRGPRSIVQTLRALHAHHPGLSRLALVGTPIDDADFAEVGRLSDLTFLNLQQTTITDEGLRHLAPLRRLRTLWINSPGITDAGMATVRGFADLEYLDLNWSHVGDAGLADLAGLTRLKTLRLGSAVTDAGTAHLAGLRDLETLILGGPALTDAGLVPLAGLPRLRMVGLPHASVTPAGVARLQASCPDADVALGLAGRVIPAPSRGPAARASPTAGGAKAGPTAP